MALISALLLAVSLASVSQVAATGPPPCAGPTFASIANYIIGNAVPLVTEVQGLDDELGSYAPLSLMHNILNGAPSWMAMNVFYSLAMSGFHPPAFAPSADVAHAIWSAWSLVLGECSGATYCMTEWVALAAACDVKSSSGPYPSSGTITCGCQDGSSENSTVLVSTAADWNCVPNYCTCDANPNKDVVTMWDVATGVMACP